jgi:tetratricopeptide (TPR) repeat protein
VNSSRQLFALLLAAAFIAVDCAYAKTIKVDAPRTQMTVREARNALVEALNHLHSINSVRKMKFNRQEITFVGEDRQMDSKGNHHDVGIPVDHVLAFAEMNNLALENSLIVQRQGKRLLLGACLAYFSQAKYAANFIDAVLTLKKAALAPDTEEADFAAFTASANTWLAMRSKPEMPDEARAYKALAEDAFKRKDFTAALEAYCSALDKFPLWPEGRYNAALLAAETEDYELAAQHMRRYLVLAPDAKDAAAAKDKFLLWQLKAKQ